MTNDITIIIWGEFPPNTLTGISVSNNLISGILEKEGCHIIQVEENTWDKKLLSKIGDLLHNYLKICYALIHKKIHVLYVNLPLSIFGLLKIIIVLFLARVLSFRTKQIAHLHRGDFSQFTSKNYFNKLIAKMFLKLINDLIVLSPRFKNEVKGFYSRNKIHVLANTSNFEDNRREWNNTYKQSYICISNYIPSKGIGDLVEAFKQDGLKDLNLDIYGNIYDQKFYDQLNKNISDNIRLNGPVARGEISKALSQYDCFILPSWNEGQPIIILEAMSLGVPIISTSVGDIQDMLGEDYQFLSGVKDIENLKEKILNFDKLKDKEEVSNYLLERYQHKYSNDIHKNQVVNIFLNK